MTPTINPLRDFRVRREDIGFLGHDLQRPECILAERNGTVWTADGRGGVMELRPDGTQELILPGSAATAVQDFEARYVQSTGSLPNGLAFTPQGDFLVANWGSDALELLSRAGKTRILVNEIGGQPLGKANFPLRDRQGRVWFSVTTREVPWTKQLNTRKADGYVAVLEPGGTVRIAAEGFCGTNEIRFDPAEEWLYVVESTGRCISRLRHQDGALSEREVYGPADLGGHPDGFAFDAHGNLWITLIFADRLVALTPEGELLTLLDDGNLEANAKYERAFAAQSLTPEIMAANSGTLAPWMASLTFGGPDLRTVYLGSLRGDRVPYFRSPVPGAPMIHWSERG